MKVLVCGGRDFFNWAFVRDVLDEIDRKETATLPQGPITEIIQGGAAGADRLARHWACLRGVPYTEYPADWGLHGRRAGHLRNTLMLDDNPNIAYVVAFPGGAGTANMIKQARERHIPVRDLGEEQIKPGGA